MGHPSTYILITGVLLGTFPYAPASRATPLESKTQFLVDGDPLTFWSTPGRAVRQTERVDLDMGAVVAVGRVSVLSRSDNSAFFPRDFEIQVSRDNITFTTVHKETGFTASPATLYPFDINPPTSGRYVRILVTRSNQSPDGLFFVQIAEITVHLAVTREPSPALIGLQVSDYASGEPIPATSVEVMSGLVELSWTAPGDNFNAGTTAVYEIRYSTDGITEANFQEASLISGAPVPEPAGTPQSHLVKLSPGYYYLAMIAIDEAGNRSPISNVVHVSIPCFENCSAALTDRLSWDESPDAVAEYRVYISETPGSYDFDNPVASVPASGSLEWPFADGGLVVGVPYVAVVTAVNADGNQSSPSNEVDFVIIDAATTTAFIRQKQE
jgi:hypothetical protein